MAGVAQQGDAALVPSRQRLARHQRPFMRRWASLQHRLHLGVKPFIGAAQLVHVAGRGPGFGVIVRLGRAGDEVDLVMGFIQIIDDDVAIIGHPFGRAVDLSSVHGGAVLCSGIITPWGSPLLAEEYFFYKTALWNHPDNHDEDEKIFFRGGNDINYIKPKSMNQYLGKMSNPYRYGYMIEMDDLLADQPGLARRYAMGRLSHENGIVMGDGRTYDFACALRAVNSVDGMTADYYPFSHEFLGETATRIINEVEGINRVTYDITSKPPGTIEWE